MNCNNNNADLQFVRFANADRFPHSELKPERAVIMWGSIWIDDLVLGWWIPGDIKPLQEA